jgi:hypothetical protein
VGSIGRLVVDEQFVVDLLDDELIVPGKRETNTG